MIGIKCQIVRNKLSLYRMQVDWILPVTDLIAEKRESRTLSIAILLWLPKALPTNL